MINNDARIFELITQKLLGTICAEDDVSLQEAIAADEQVKRCWEELYEANVATGHTLLQDLEAAEAWQLLQLEAEPEADVAGKTIAARPEKRGLFWWAFVALLVLAVILYWCLRPATGLVAVPAAAVVGQVAVEVVFC